MCCVELFCSALCSNVKCCSVLLPSSYWLTVQSVCLFNSDNVVGGSVTVVSVYGGELIVALRLFAAVHQSDAGLISLFLKSANRRQMFNQVSECRYTQNYFAASFCPALYAWHKHLSQMVVDLAKSNDLLFVVYCMATDFQLLRLYGVELIWRVKVVVDES